MQILNNTKRVDKNLETYLNDISKYLDNKYPLISPNIIIEITNSLLDTQFKDLEHETIEGVAGVERIVDIKGKRYFVGTVNLKKCDIEPIANEFIVTHEICHAILDNILDNYSDEQIKYFVCNTDEIETGYMLMCEHYANKKSFELVQELGYSLETKYIQESGRYKIKELINNNVHIKSRKLACGFLDDIERYLAYIASTSINRVCETDDKTSNLLNELYIRLEYITSLVENGLATKERMEKELDYIGKLHCKLFNSIRTRFGRGSKKRFKQQIKDINF